MFKIRVLLVLGSVFCLSGVSLTGQETDYTNYDYGDVSKKVDDISFYRGAENTEPYAQQDIATGTETKAQNVIFLIGDGMGVNQVQLARLNAVGADGKLYMEKLPVTGLIKTHSANSSITDSAAAGTALACGIKTNNGTIGMTPDKKSYQNLLEAAQEKNKKTGIVATSAVSHATPASFSSHVESRSDQQQISVHILEHHINVIFGGGMKHWVSESRNDNRDLMGEAKDKGYAIVGNKQKMQQVEADYVLGLFNDGPLTTFSPEPSIGEMTRKAIDLLNNDKKNPESNLDISRGDGGFFLMVEGSQIDWACHANNADNCIKQTLLFDLAVREAVEFAKKDKHTLVVITADHECGGLTVFGGNAGKEGPRVKWSTGGHSAADVPVYAFGPGAERFSGVMDNTKIAIKIAEAMGVKNFPKAHD